jgi:type VI secretion system protein ImpC
MLDDTEPGARVPASGPDAWLDVVERGGLERLLDCAVQSSLVRIDTREQAALIEGVDRVLSETVGGIVHDREFQRLEGSWRGLQRLVSAIDDDATFKVQAIDCSRERLARLLDREPDDGSGPLVAALSVHDARPILVLCAHEFGPNAGDLARLSRLAEVTAAVGASCVAAAAPAFVGAEGFGDVPEPRALESVLGLPAFEAWRAFRGMPAAATVALVLPRILSRLPYGAATDPIDRWAFEECPAPVRHEALLWESGVFAVGAMVAEAFAEAGWALDLSTVVRLLEGLPVLVLEEGDGRTLVPPAEVWLTDEHVHAIEAHGLTPLVSHRGGGAVAIRALQATASPRAPLRLAPR